IKNINKEQFLIDKLKTNDICVSSINKNLLDTHFYNKSYWRIAESFNLTRSTNKIKYGLKLDGSCAAKISGIVPNSIANLAGLQIDDSVIKINEINVSRSTAQSVLEIISGNKTNSINLMIARYNINSRHMFNGNLNNNQINQKLYNLYLFEFENNAYLINSMKLLIEPLLGIKHSNSNLKKMLYFFKQFLCISTNILNNIRNNENCRSLLENIFKQKYRIIKTVEAYNCKMRNIQISYKKLLNNETVKMYLNHLPLRFEFEIILKYPIMYLFEFVNKVKDIYALYRSMCHTSGYSNYIYYNEFLNDVENCLTMPLNNADCANKSILNNFTNVCNSSLYHDRQIAISDIELRLVLGENDVSIRLDENNRIFIGSFQAKITIENRIITPIFFLFNDIIFIANNIQNLNLVDNIIYTPDILYVNYIDKKHCIICTSTNLIDNLNYREIVLTFMNQEECFYSYYILEKNTWIKNKIFHKRKISSSLSDKILEKRMTSKMNYFKNVISKSVMNIYESISDGFKANSMNEFKAIINNQKVCL
ncbi:hypothetical protein A3Q56_01746, partial [Intoshia linei]